MRTILLLIFVATTCLSCNANENRYKQEIANYIQVENGVKSELDIRFTEIAIKNFTVADSIKVLNERFEKEKAKKIEEAQNSVNHYEESIKKQKMKGDDLVANALIRNLTPKLETAKRELNAAYNWQPDYLSRYSNLKEDMVLVQVVDCRFSLLNPKLKFRQEGPASFIFSADGLKLLKLIK